MHPTPTAHIENHVAVLNRNVLQSPLGHLGMTTVHTPKIYSPEPAARLTALLQQRALEAHDDCVPLKAKDPPNEQTDRKILTVCEVAA